MHHKQKNAGSYDLCFFSSIPLQHLKTDAKDLFIFAFWSSKPRAPCLLPELFSADCFVTGAGPSVPSLPKDAPSTIA